MKRPKKRARTTRDEVKLLRRHVTNLSLALATLKLNPSGERLSPDRFIQGVVQRRGPMEVLLTLDAAGQWWELRRDTIPGPTPTDPKTVEEYFTPLTDERRAAK